MFEALVVTLREGIEAALVVGIILAYLKKTGMQNLNKYVNYGLVMGIVASVLGAIIFSVWGLDADNKFYEGIMYFISAFFVITMVIWMWKTSQNIKKNMLNKLEKIVVQEKNNNGLGLLVFTFLMVLREGIETVLFIAALGQGRSPLMSLIGSIIGIIIAVLVGLLLIYGSLRINISLFFKVTGISLILLAIKLLAGGVLEFGDAHLLVLGKLDNILAFIAEGVSSQVISLVLVAIPLTTFIYSILKDLNLKKSLGNN